MDRADYDSNEYFGGQVASVLVPSPTAIARQGSVAWKLYNKFDDSGKCASMLTRLVHGQCFVAGTKITIAELPYCAARETSVWSETDWLGERLEAGDWGLEAESLEYLPTLDTRQTLHCQRLTIA